MDPLEKALDDVTRLARESDAAREAFEQAVVRAHELGGGYKKIAAAAVDREGEPRSVGLIRGILARRRA